MSNVPAPAIAQTTLRLAKAPSVSPTLTQATYTPTAISSPVSASPTIPTTVLTSASSTGSANIGYQFVTVGNPGNANDPATGNQYGAVNYSYDIGKYDVTLTQYCAFLNAVAVTDSYGLYDPNMASDAHVAGISRTGPNGAYSYSVIGDGQRPVTYVTWFDAARFANWVNNGQPTGLGEVNGSTEDGAYILHGATSGVVNKQPNAQVWIPTESEWYKAAYYDPTLNGGAGGYWADAARSNSVPGNTIGSQPNQANYFNGTYSTGGAGNNYLTDVGAFSMSMSPYGTYDQMGDVYQWNDAVIGLTRGYRGGAWNDFASSYLLSSNALYADPGTTSGPNIGFRLAGIPEPAVWPSLLGGAGLLLARRRRRHAA